MKDLEWIHVDVERANRVLGGTIVHGLLTLSLVPWMSRTMLHIVDRGTDLNYGYDNVRFLAVVHGAIESGCAGAYSNYPRAEKDCY